MNKMVKIALDYKHEHGFCVIPAKGKKPLVNWTEFQDEMPTDEQLEAWWSNDDTNIAIVTGEVSSYICVVDVDAYKDSSVMGSARALIPEGLEFPISTTPSGGEHWWFRSSEQLGDKIGFIDGCDFRSKGIIVMSPSEGYEWEVGLDEVEIPALPDKILKSMQVSVSHAQQESFYGEEHSLPQENKTSTKQLSSLASLVSKASKSIGHDDKNGTEYFAEGRRDDDLFSVANALIKTGLNPVLVIQTLTRLVHTWGEHDPTWVRKKVESAMKRHNHDNLALDIRQYVMSTSGIFTSSEVSRELCLSSRKDKQNCSKILGRLFDDGVIERTGSKNGQFRRIEKEREILDWKSVDPLDFYDLKMPLGIHDMCNISKTNIVVIAGDGNAGKTAFALNVALMNKDKKVRYINSEMDETEIAQRIAFFDAPKSDWDHVEFSRLKGDGADDVGSDDLNIIDYIEPDEYWQMPKMISAIHARLKGGVCIICLQKKDGEKYGKGGSGTAERCRLYISMEDQKLKIVKCKSPKHGQKISGKEIRYKLINGTTFTKESQ